MNSEAFSGKSLSLSELAFLAEPNSQNLVKIVWIKFWVYFSHRSSSRLRTEVQGAGEIGFRISDHFEGSLSPLRGLGRSIRERQRRWKFVFHISCSLPWFWIYIDERKRTAKRNWYMLVKCLFEGLGDRGYYYSIIIWFKSTDVGVLWMILLIYISNLFL